MSKDATADIPVAEAPVKRPPLNKYAVACAVLASMNSILLGYDVSVMSGAQIFLKRDLKITDTQIEILAGIINIFSLVGSLAAGRTSDWIGRRYTMVLAAVIFFAGALIEGLASNYAVLMIGRFVAGVGVGYALMIAPVYTAEVAPTSARGLLTSFPEVFINTGVLLGYISNYAFHSLPVHISWRAMFLAGAVPPVFLAFGVLAMPESPRWLVMQGRIGDARRVLQKTSDSPEEAVERLSDIMSAVGIPEGISEDRDEVVAIVRKNKGTHGEGVLRELLLHPTPPVRRILIACLGLQFFQQASGIDSVVLYSPKVFETAGIKSDANSLGATISVGATKTLFILVATFLLDRVGRRPLLLTSAAGMVVSLVTLASVLHVITGRAAPADGATALSAVSIASVLAFVASFSIGMGPIAWVYSSEIFPLRFRAQGCALGTAMNRIMSGTITMSFYSLSKKITLAGSFFLYASVAAAGWVFMFCFLPETRGRSLENTEMLFGGGGDGGEKEDGHGKNKSTELTTQ